MDQSIIQHNGQVMLPPEILSYLNLQEGDSVFISLEKGEIHLAPRKKVSLMDLYGFLQKPNKALTVEEMNQVIQENHDRD
jgi:antitoxin component of MazEF toxin-antitoxin module